MNLGETILDHYEKYLGEYDIVQAFDNNFHYNHAYKD